MNMKFKFMVSKMVVIAQIAGLTLSIGGLTSRVMADKGSEIARGYQVGYVNNDSDKSAGNGQPLLYTVAIESIGLNRKDGRLKPNDLLIEATLETDEFPEPVKILIFSERDPGVEGRLGIINFNLLDYIDVNDNPIKLSLKITRYKRNDVLRKFIKGLPTLIPALMKGSSATALINPAYPAALQTAQPGFLAGAAAANQLLSIFATAEDEVLFELRPMTLYPERMVNNTDFILSDRTYLIYRGTEPLARKKDQSLELSNNNWSMKKGPWVAFRIDKISQPTDWERKWPTDFRSSINHLKQALYDGNGQAINEAQSKFKSAIQSLNEDKYVSQVKRQLVYNAWRTKFEEDYAKYFQKEIQKSTLMIDIDAKKQ